MDILKSIAIAALAAATATSTAQTLNQEIEIQHQVTVDHYDAARIALRPQTSLPALTVKPLQYSERSVSIDIPSAITMLEPAAFADTLATSPYNGYAAIGYFPAYNLGASAGYRFIDNDRSRLNAWMQFDGKSYTDGRTFDPVRNRHYDATIKRNTVTVGANYHVMIGRKSEIDAGLDYTFSRFNAPGAQGVYDGNHFNRLYDQSVNRVNASVQWMSAIGGLSYTAGLDYGYFGYRRGFESSLFSEGLEHLYLHLAEADRPVRENVFLFNGAASLALSDYSAAYLGLDFDVVSDSRRSYLDAVNNGCFDYLLRPDGRYSHGVFTITPRYRAKTDNFLLTLGARLQFSFNSGKVIHISPDVNVSWTPTSMLTLWGKAGGGVHLNTLSSLYEVNYMTAPMLAYKDSNLPLTIDGGIVVGPFKGAYAEISVGYAAANDWLMPVGYPGSGYGPVMFREVDMRGWHFGVKAGYKYRKWADAQVSAQFAPRKYDRGYYLWRDRARCVVEASVTSHPIDRLDVGVSYRLRSGRALMDCSTLVTATAISRNSSFTPLGSVSDFGINGSWHFSDRLTAFLNIENLFNHRSTTLGLVEDQGIHGLAGVSYKF